MRLLWVFAADWLLWVFAADWLGLVTSSPVWLGSYTELRIAMGAPRVIGAVVVCLGKALLGPFGL